MNSLATLQQRELCRSMSAMSDSSETITFNGVYGTYRDSIYTYILTRTGNRDVTEDIVSDVFLKVYEKIDTYNPKYAVSTWLYTIARNTLTDYYRAKKEHFDIDTYDVADDSDPLFEVLSTEISTEDISKALEQLTEQQRACVQEKFFNHKNAKEIAETLDMTHESVRKHLSRAVKTLRTTLVPGFMLSTDMLYKLLERIV